MLPTFFVFVFVCLCLSELGKEICAKHAERTDEFVGQLDNVAHADVGVVRAHRNGSVSIVQCYARISSICFAIDEVVRAIESIAIARGGCEWR